jgi:outer membrane protein TolC
LTFLSLIQLELRRRRSYNLAHLFAFQLVFLALSLSTPSHAETLSFEEALKTILAKDTRIRIADENKDAVNGKNLYTRFHLLPTIGIEGTDGWSNFPGERVRGITGTAKFSVFKFGADQAALDSALANERAADFTVKQTILDEEKLAVQALVSWVRLNLEQKF